MRAGFERMRRNLAWAGRGLYNAILSVVYIEDITSRTADAASDEADE